ncbi:MAG TPA: sigma-70 family RNA polymerase sigma factor [Polyangiaceae bacterium]|nr:sigma-70 family RNA polymerase sigma factor [Polyangiaceae bacterium]
MTLPHAFNTPPSEADAPLERVASTEQIREVVEREYAVVWRFLRRLGVPEAHVDDAAHSVFARVLAKDSVILAGAERAYLMKAAFHISFEYRRSQKRAYARSSAQDADELSSREPLPDELLAQRERRRMLDAALQRLSPELRAVFTLFELEGLSFTEISQALDIPRGTVASRVRRARELFTEAVQRLTRGALP